MIRPLRVRHRVTVLVLAVVLPPLFVAALAGREPEARAQALGAELVDGTPCGTAAWSDPGRWGELEITTRVGRSRGSAFCELEARAPLAVPDLLVYWSAGGAAEALPDDAVLLGSWPGDRRCFALPPEFDGGPGHLVLYSLAHSRVVGAASLARGSD